MTHPLRTTSSSTAYHFPCHVPQPSSYLSGTTFSRIPLRFGERKNQTSTRSPNSSMRGRRRWAVDSASGGGAGWSASAAAAVAEEAEGVGFDKRVDR